MAQAPHPSWQTLGGAVVVVITVVSLLGLNGTVGALEDRVNDLDAVAERIDENQEQIQALHVELQVVRRQAAELAGFRNDILAAICAANAATAGDLRDCYRTVNGASGQPGPLPR